MVDVETSDISSMSKIRCDPNDTVGDLKQIIAVHLKLDAIKITLAILNFQTESRILDCDSTTVLKESVSKFFVRQNFTIVSKIKFHINEC